MLGWTFNFLFFAMLLAGVGGYVLNSDDTGLLDLYVRVIAGRGVSLEVKDAAERSEVSREQERNFFTDNRSRRSRMRARMRELDAKIAAVRRADRIRRNDSNNKINTLNQRNDDNIRRQQDRLRNLQQMSRSRMSNFRNRR